MTSIRFHAFANHQEQYDIPENSFAYEVLMDLIVVDMNLFRVFIVPDQWTLDELFYVCHSLENYGRRVYMRGDDTRDSDVLLIYPRVNLMEATLPIQEEKTKKMTAAEFKQLIGREKFLIRETKKVNGDLSCSICLEKFRSGRMVAKTSCNHRYHIQCLKDYFCEHGGTCCPICRCDQMPTGNSEDSMVVV